MNSGENKYRGYTITINQDEFNDFNPRTENDNVGKMVCFHTRYDLGDDHGDNEEFVLDLLVELPEKNIASCLRKIGGWTKEDLQAIKEDPADFLTWGYIADGLKETMDMILAEIQNHFIVLPLYLYDHSGITMSTSSFSCNWDSGQVGWIYCTNKQAIAEWGKKILDKKTRQKAIDYLIGEVKTYDQFLTGDVWHFDIQNPDGCDIDSCGGFFGFEYVEQECISIVDNDFPIWKEKRIKEIKERKSAKREEMREEFLSQFVNPFCAVLAI